MSRPPDGRLPAARVRLILRGDDAGSSSTANAAIVDACKAGTLRNVSVMACGPAFEEAAAMLRPILGLCIGLHVTLNSEWPSPRWGPVSGAGQCPSLLYEDQTFRRTPDDHLREGFVVSEAIVEVQAQLDRMRRAGLPPAYLDEHMGFGRLPGVREALATLAAKEGLFNVEAAKLERVRIKPNTLCDSAGLLVESIGETEAGNLIYITHPDFTLTYAAWPGGDWDARVRDADRRFFLDPQFTSVLQHAGIEAVTFSSLAALSNT